MSGFDTCQFNWDGGPLSVTFIRHGEPQPGLEFLPVADEKTMTAMELRRGIQALGMTNEPEAEKLQTVLRALMDRKGPRVMRLDTLK